MGHPGAGSGINNVCEVNSLRKRFWIMVMLLCLTVSFAMAEEAPTSSDILYTAAMKGYTLPVYGGEAVTTPVSLSLSLGEKGQAVFTVPEDGQYEIWLSYQNTAETTLPTEMNVMLDGTQPFSELQRVKLNSLWVDDGVFPTDRYGNEIATTPYAADVISEAGMCDSAGRTADPFLFELTAGEHTLTFAVQDGGVDISALTLKAPVEIPAYAGQAAVGSNIVVIEAEQILSRSKSSIRGAGEFNAKLSPYSTEHRMVNFLDGASFDSAGDTVTWTFTVPETGWYQIGAYYRQNARADFPTYVDVLIDGAIPSQEAREVGFDYSTSFTNMTMKTSDGANQTFYLEAGDHTLSLRINASNVTPIYETIDVLLSEINALSNDIQSLMGGATADKYRSYHMLDNFPTLVEQLEGWADQCEASVTYAKQFSPIGSGSAFSNMTLCADQLRRLAKKPEDLPRRMAEFSTGANSAARMLAQQLTDMAVNDLSIDQIYIYQESAELPQKPGFLETTMKSVERFFRSFAAQDYAASSGNKEHLQVWMGRSRQYVETVQNLIDTEFTPKTGIQVDISLMPDANKLVLANAAGTAPDVVLSLQYVIPSYLNIRGALYDLTQFEDFPEVAQRFASGLFVPYILGDGVYAMPETVNFWVMFYRKDILDNLGIAVPNSMDEVKLILPELQRRSMNFYFPTAGMVGNKVFPGTLPLILQAGGSIYDKTVGDTTLDSEISLSGFREMTELFTVYNMPTDVPAPGFYQQFRDGTLPIGIADLATYNLLLNAAPELDGLWDIALFPGLTNEDGEVLRYTTGGAETMAIMSQTKMPEESWEFLKWWSSNEVQAEFGSLLQSTYGSEYIWPTANREAFSTLPLRAAHKQVIIDQMQWMTEAPWVLGTYMLERELSNAFISVTVNGIEARRAMDTAVKRINRETYRKLEEFGYYADGEMLEDFITPNVSVITRLIERYNKQHAAEEVNEQ